MNIDLFYTSLLLAALVLSIVNIYLYMFRKRQKTHLLNSDITNQKLLILKKEISLLEKRNNMMEERIANIATSLVTYEKVLTTLITASSGPVLPPDDGTYH
tara:strand:- start:246 stop:548 length:303 start_codon:yes stop_codon:yes gene_type:complete